MTINFKWRQALTIKLKWRKVKIRIRRFVDTDEDTSNSFENELNVTVILRRTNRPHKQRVFPDCVSYFVHVLDPDDPLTVEEAMNGHDRELWKNAMDEEFETIQENETWELCDLTEKLWGASGSLKQKKIAMEMLFVTKLGWLFKVSYSAEGSIMKKPTHQSSNTIQFGSYWLWLQNLILK